MHYYYLCFFFNDTATTEIYTLSLHDALPISIRNCNFSYIGGSYKSKSTRYGNAIEFWNSNSNILVENSYFSEIYDGALTSQGSSGTLVSNLTFRNNIITTSAYGFEYWHRGSNMIVDGIYIEGNTFANQEIGRAHV